MVYITLFMLVLTNFSVELILSIHIINNMVRVDLTKYLYEY